MEKYEENLNNALKEIRIADHILYITYHIIKDKRLLLKSLDQEYEALINIINATLQYEYLWKRVQLYNDPKLNFETFVNKCSKRYNITPKEIEEINQFIVTVEMHKKSSIEFMRRESIVIMSNGLKTALLNQEKLKKYLQLIKNIIKKVSFAWNQNPFIN
jgi:hypothetical protein